MRLVLSWRPPRVKRPHRARLPSVLLTLSFSVFLVFFFFIVIFTGSLPHLHLFLCVRFTCDWQRELREQRRKGKRGEMSSGRHCFVFEARSSVCTCWRVMCVAAVSLPLHHWRPVFGLQAGKAHGRAEPSHAVKAWFVCSSFFSCVCISLASYSASPNKKKRICYAWNYITVSVCMNGVCLCVRMCIIHRSIAFPMLCYQFIPLLGRMWCCAILNPWIACDIILFHTMLHI